MGPDVRRGAGSRDGGPRPFAESVEQVGGFYLVESDDLDDLMDCCRILSATGDGIEVRRTVTQEDRSS